MRLDKLISDTTPLSRREATAVIKKGGVSVNGIPVKDPSSHVNPEGDNVICLGKRILYNKYVYVMLNKPEGYVSATEDSSLPVVTELLPDEYRRLGLFPVGRLDRDTVGLMVLTNNGVLAHALLSPKRHVEKKYFARFAEPLKDGAEDMFKDGITLADGYECKSAGIVTSDGRMSGVITLTEGKYHQIKRMLGALSNRVTYLERISFGNLTLDTSLSRGEWRLLTDDELQGLLSLAPESLRG